MTSYWYLQFKFSLTGFFLPHLYLLFTHNKTLVAIKIIGNTCTSQKIQKTIKFLSLRWVLSHPVLPLPEANHHSQFLVHSSRYFIHVKSMFPTPLMSPYYTLFSTLLFPHNNPSEIIPYPYIYNCLSAYVTVQ